MLSIQSQASCQPKFGNFAIQGGLKQADKVTKYLIKQTRHDSLFDLIIRYITGTTEPKFRMTYDDIFIQKNLEGTRKFKSTNPEPEIAKIEEREAIHNIRKGNKGFLGFFKRKPMTIHEIKQ